MFCFQAVLGFGPLRIGKNLVRHPEKLAEVQRSVVILLLSRATVNGTGVLAPHAFLSRSDHHRVGARRTNAAAAGHLRCAVDFV